MIKRLKYGDTFVCRCAIGARGTPVEYVRIASGILSMSSGAVYEVKEFEDVEIVIVGNLTKGSKRCERTN